MVLNMKSRVLRSSSSTSAPAGRVKDTSTRKEYAHNSSSAIFGSSSVSSAGSSNRKSSAVFDRFHKVMAWSNTRKVPLINFIIIVIFMVVTLSTSLMLRTQMAELSFEQTATQSRISRLRQDVETKQAKLDTLEAELPAKAQDMGMVPQQGSIAIDLSDYAAKRKHNREKSKEDKSKEDKSKEDKSKNDKTKDDQSKKDQSKTDKNATDKTKQKQQQQVKQEKH
ncbi:hypothetical protein GK675_03515 [Bifidobacteriaceae bacterium NR002]|nr:hypothetical protein [Bifidobacteriaceae bacterium NR002]MDZ7549380.1 hypothetical protein [Bifidobacteriaceae bacterium NR047]